MRRHEVVIVLEINRAATYGILRRALLTWSQVYSVAYSDGMPRARIYAERIFNLER